MHEYLVELYGVTEESLRTTAFGFVSEATTTVVDCPPWEALIGSRIDFDGPIRGSISLNLPERLATYLTANMAALDENDPATAESRPDALCEILNTICGRFLPRVRPDAQEFSIGIPRLATRQELQVDVSQRSLDGRFPDGTLCLDIDVEGNPVRLVLAIEERAPSGGEPS